MRPDGVAELLELPGVEQMSLIQITVRSRSSRRQLCTPHVSQFWLGHVPAAAQVARTARVPSAVASEGMGCEIPRRRARVGV